MPYVYVALDHCTSLQHLSGQQRELVTHGGLCLQLAPTLKRRRHVPQSEIRNSHLPIRNMVKIAILILDFHRPLIVLQSLRRLATAEFQTALAEEEEDPYDRT